MIKTRNISKIHYLAYTESKARDCVVTAGQNKSRQVPGLQNGDRYLKWLKLKKIFSKALKFTSLEHE